MQTIYPVWFPHHFPLSSLCLSHPPPSTSLCTSYFPVSTNQTTHTHQQPSKFSLPECEPEPHSLKSLRKNMPHPTPATTNTHTQHTHEHFPAPIPFSLNVKVYRHFGKFCNVVKTFSVKWWCMHCLNIVTFPLCSHFEINLPYCFWKAQFLLRKRLKNRLMGSIKQLTKHKPI